MVRACSKNVKDFRIQFCSAKKNCVKKLNLVFVSPNKPFPVLRGQFICKWTILVAVQRPSPLSQVLFQCLLLQHKHTTTTRIQFTYSNLPSLTSLPPSLSYQVFQLSSPFHFKPHHPNPGLLSLSWTITIASQSLCMALATHSSSTKPLLSTTVLTIALKCESYAPFSSMSMAFHCSLNKTKILNNLKLHKYKLKTKSRSLFPFVSLSLIILLFIRFGNLQSYLPSRCRTCHSPAIQAFLDAYKIVQRVTTVSGPSGGFQETRAVSSSISVTFTPTGGPAGAVHTYRRRQY